MRTSAASLAAEEGDTRLRARRGLAIYFAVLVPLSAVFEAIVIISGDLSVIWALMWTPAAASVVARLALREGFADVSFRLECVMNLGENRIGMRILRLARSPAILRFPHSQAIPDRVHNSL